MARTIKQNVIINAKPEEVYSALMDSKKHSAFTGAKAKVSKKVGGQFSCYDGYIEGVNVELVEKKRVIQAWRGTNWKQGEWTLAVFNLKKKGKRTDLSFVQYGVPDEHAPSIRTGWKTHYWEKMNEYFSNKK